MLLEPDLEGAAGICQVDGRAVSGGNGLMGRQPDTVDIGTVGGVQVHDGDVVREAADLAVGTADHFILAQQDVTLGRIAAQGHGTAHRVLEAGAGHGTGIQVQRNAGLGLRIGQLAVFGLINRGILAIAACRGNRLDRLNGLDGLNWLNGLSRHVPHLCAAGCSLGVGTPLIVLLAVGAGPDDQEDTAEGNKYQQIPPAALAHVMQAADCQSQIGQEHSQRIDAGNAGNQHADQEGDQEIKQGHPPELASSGAAFEVYIIDKKQLDRLKESNFGGSFRVCRHKTPLFFLY